MTTYWTPEGLDQANTTEAAAERRAVKLVLVHDDGINPPIRHHTNADAAWTYGNDAYEHCEGSFESTLAGSACWYEEA